MPILEPENWTEPMPPVKPVLNVDEIKASIETMVVLPMDYGVIVDAIQADYIAENKHFRDADILAVITEVDAEWHGAEAEAEGVPL